MHDEGMLRYIVNVGLGQFQTEAISLLACVRSNV